MLGLSVPHGQVRSGFAPCPAARSGLGSLPCLAGRSGQSVGWRHDAGVGSGLPQVE
jgi:hypothetical protein